MSTAGEKTPRKRKQTENAISKNVNSSKKKRKTSKPLQDAANDEHAQLLGSVTGQIGRLPEEASSVEENVSESEKQDCGSDEKKSKKETSGVDKWVALNYLSVWDTNRERWSFKKKVQYWLLQNMYNKDELSKPHFKIMLHYLDGLQGNQRSIVRDRAKVIQAQYQSKSDTEAKRKHKRATKVIKVLTPEE